MKVPTEQLTGFIKALEVFVLPDNDQQPVGTKDDLIPKRPNAPYRLSVILTVVEEKTGEEVELEQEVSKDLLEGDQLPLLIAHVNMNFLKSLGYKMIKLKRGNTVLFDSNN